MNLTAKILIGMAAGFVLGGVLNLAGMGEVAWVNAWLVDGIFELGGQIFLNALRLLVVPLVLVSLVCGASNLSDTAAMGRLGGKSVGLYLLTTGIAVSMALAVAVVVGPGEGVQAPETDSTFQAQAAPSLVEVLASMVPTNPVAALAEGKMLQIIVFALLLGVAITQAGESGARIKAVFEDLNEVIMKLVMLLIRLAPLGVFCLMAGLFTRMGFDVFGNLIAYFLTVAGVLLVHALVVYPLLLSSLARLNPLIFFRKMRANQVVAFSTSSSGATLPVTLRTVEERLGVRNEVASFTVPLGATINMDGTAIMQGVATVFIAQYFAVDLSFTDYMLVVATATLASIGTAGVPGVGLIMLAMVLDQVGLPVEGIGLIIGVDRLLDMMRTAVNVTGDATVACVVARSEGRFDEAVFNDPDAGLLDEDDEVAPASAGA